MSSGIGTKVKLKNEAMLVDSLLKMTVESISDNSKKSESLIKVFLEENRK